VVLAAALTSVALAIVGLATQGHQVGSFQRVMVPGRGEITFSAAGDYLLYVEGPGLNRGAVGTVPVLLQSESDHSRVPISTQAYSQSEAYSLGGHSGRAVASVTITQPGRYLLTSGKPTAPAPADIAIGPDIGAALGRSVVLGVLGMLALAWGSIGAIAAARRRSRLLASGGMAQQFPAA
jgi:hypothetical protein